MTYKPQTCISDIVLFRIVFLVIPRSSMITLKAIEISNDFVEMLCLHIPTLPQIRIKKTCLSTPWYGVNNSRPSRSARRGGTSSTSASMSGDIEESSAQRSSMSAFTMARLHTQTLSTKLHKASTLDPTFIMVCVAHKCDCKRHRHLAFFVWGVRSNKKQMSCANSQRSFLICELISLKILLNSISKEF